MAKMAAGIADNLLLTTYLSARCPVFIAPAMDLDMLNHPATQKEYGNPPGHTAILFLNLPPVNLPADLSAKEEWKNLRIWCRP